MLTVTTTAIFIMHNFLKRGRGCDVCYLHFAILGCRYVINPQSINQDFCNQMPDLRIYFPWKCDEGSDLFYNMSGLFFMGSHGSNICKKPCIAQFKNINFA